MPRGGANVFEQWSVSGDENLVSQRPRVVAGAAVAVGAQVQDADDGAALAAGDGNVVDRVEPLVAVQVFDGNVGRIAQQRERGDVRHL